ncbi:lipocalin-like domain-containing protein [Allohahella marinimesophila]
MRHGPARQWRQLRKHLVIASVLASLHSQPQARGTEQYDSILHNTPSQSASSASAEFRQVTPGRQFQFPQDHAPHPGFRIEWWYLTANMKDEQDRDWGLQWTLFRTALGDESRAEGWESPVIWMAHAALSPPVLLPEAGGHQFEQRFARGGIGQAGVSSVDDILEHGFEAWLDDWLLKSRQAGALLPAALHFSVGDKQLAFELRELGPIVLQGDKGYSRKSSDGQASYYYSHPNIAIEGRVMSKDGSIALEGLAWLDREWSSTFLAEDQTGWDWFALHLDDGRKLMIYRLRSALGQDNFSGTLVAADGHAQTLDQGAIDLTPLQSTTLKNGVVLPLRWRLELPELQLGWTLSTDNPEQFMQTTVPYWEGRIEAEPMSGSPAGIGYMELTGYRAAD